MGGKRKNKPEDGASTQAEPPRPLTPVIRAEFKRGYKLQTKRGKDMAKLEAIVAALVARRPLAPRYRDYTP